ncbi:hypothetical protein PMAYCL1PPCAC_03968, partial [Pristionchus mayeri]
TLLSFPLPPSLKNDRRLHAQLQLHRGWMVGHPLGAHRAHLVLLTRLYHLHCPHSDSAADGGGGSEAAAVRQLPRPDARAPRETQGSIRSLMRRRLRSSTTTSTTSVKVRYSHRE